jgi:hypothetical protein
MRPLISPYLSVGDDVAALAQRAEERPQESLDVLRRREEGWPRPSRSPSGSEGLAGRQALEPHMGTALGCARETQFRRIQRT